jgi:hypothetical protein
MIMKANLHSISLVIFALMVGCQAPSTGSHKPQKSPNVDKSADKDSKQSTQNEQHMASQEPAKQQGGGGSSTHGGDSAMLVFDKARPLAIQMVEAYLVGLPTKGVAVDNVEEWFTKYGKDLIDEIHTSRLVPVEENLDHDAVTGNTRGAVIKISLLTLKENPLTIPEAAALLIHECIHHLDVTDESFAYSATSSATEHWLKQNSEILAPVRVTRLPKISPFGSNRIMGHPFILSQGSNIFVWTFQQAYADYGNEPFRGVGYIYTPSTKSWSPIATQSRPSRICSTVAVGDKVLVFGNDGTSQAHAIYEPKLDVWRPIATVPETNWDLFCSAHRVWTGTDLYLFHEGRDYENINFADGQWTNSKRVKVSGLRYNVQQDFWMPIKNVPEQITSVHHIKGGELIVTTKKGVFKFSDHDDSWEQILVENEPDDFGDFGIWVLIGNCLVGFNRDATYYKGGDPVKAAIFDLNMHKWKKIIQSNRAPINPGNFVVMGKRIAFAEEENRMRLHMFSPEERDWKIVNLDHPDLRRWEPDWANWNRQHTLDFSWLNNSLLVFKDKSSHIYSLDFNE